ncbi:MAG: c-type cytochrome [Bacteroidetes bacterium]|nr:c-type cytochrome [Bacteroidota bacterium]
MKKVLKYVGIALGGILLLLLCFGLYINIKGIPTYEVHAPEVAIEMDSSSIANGKRLTTMICAGCHMAEDRKLTGRLLHDIPASFGKTWSQNITRHETEGLGRYTDGELIYLLRTGIKRDGNYCPPWMPSYPLMADDDLEDIVAFLRSDDPMTEPSDKVQPAPQPSFLVKMLSNFAFKPTPMPKQEIKTPSVSDKLAYGEYVMNGMLGCFQCHSSDFATNNAMDPPKSEGYYAGGNPIVGPDGEIVPAANLTPHETGIQDWTKEEFAAAVLNGQRRGGGSLNPAMPPHPQLTSEEIDAMWAFVQTLPPTENQVERLMPE